MPTADTGNWDLVIEIATSAIQRALGGLLPSSLPTTEVSNPAFRGTVTPHVSPGTVSLSSGGDVTIGLAIDGTEINVEEIFLPIPGVKNPPPPWLSKIVLHGQVHITDHLEMSGNDLVIDFATDSGRSQPAVSVTLDEASLLAAPLVQFALAAAFFAGGEAAYVAARHQLVEEVQAQIKQQVLGALASRGRVTLVAAPNISGHPITGSALLTQSQSLHLCYALCNPAGSTAAISRSMLLTTTAGATADVAAFAISNACLLGCFVKPEAIARFGLPPGGFTAGHPCFFIGPSTIPVSGLPSVISEVTLETLLAGIDESGLLRLLINLTVHGVAGAFKITASVDVALSIRASVSGGNLAIELAEARPTIVESDISIEWWVYVAGGLTGGFGIAAILGLVDLFGGQFLNGPLAGLIGGLAIPPVTAPLPTATPPVRVREVKSVEPDSPRRTLATFGGITIPDPFRSHDVIVNFI
ncbi:MAG: hypothetical protein ACTHK6_00350 [Solirubrobacterales bacterium]